MMFTGTEKRHEALRKPNGSQMKEVKPLFLLQTCSLSLACLICITLIWSYLAKQGCDYQSPVSSTTKQLWKDGLGAKRKQTSEVTQEVTWPLVSHHPADWLKSLHVVTSGS